MPARLVELGVRRHSALPVLCSRDELTEGLAPDNDRFVLRRLNASWQGNDKIIEGPDVTNARHTLLEALEVCFCFNELWREVELVVRPWREPSGH